jgi:hypothetical protein
MTVYCKSVTFGANPTLHWGPLINGSMWNPRKQSSSGIEKILCNLHRCELTRWLYIKVSIQTLKKC